MTDYWSISLYGIIFVCCLTLMVIAFFNTYNVFGAKRDIKNIQIKNEKGISTPKVTTGEIHGKDNVLNVMGKLSTTGEINSSTIDSINKKITVLNNNQNETNIKMNEMKNKIHELEIALVSASKKIGTLESRLVRLGTAIEAYDIAHSNHTYFNHI